MKKRDAHKEVYIGKTIKKIMNPTRYTLKIIKKELHCCNLMTELLEDPRISLQYFPILREYCMPLKNSSALQGILYCPWCGIKLPSSLRDAYFDILENEYQISHVQIRNNRKIIPEEFKSDQWWKKRRL